MHRGLLIKGVGGFYDVLGEDGSVRRCTARGSIKNKVSSLMVGDIVSYEPRMDDEYGTVEDVADRKNSFVRPPVANVDCFVIVISRKMPKVDFGLIDRFLTMAEYKRTEVVICINKSDLIDDAEIQEIKEVYEPIYPIFVSSDVDRDSCGLDELAKAVAGKKVAFAGPSGVGKSTIINRLLPDVNVEVGEISSKSQRGKHTTRHVELFPWRDGYVFDTPGFSQLEYIYIDREELRELFPEIDRIGRGCKFSDCSHRNEPGCKVIEALKEGKISQSRYTSYIEGYKEIENYESKKK